MRPERPNPDEHDSVEAGLGEAQADNPPSDPEMIEPESDPLDTDVEDADLFVGLDEDEQ